MCLVNSLKYVQVRNAAVALGFRCIHIKKTKLTVLVDFSVSQKAETKGWGHDVLTTITLLMEISWNNIIPIRMSKLNFALHKLSVA